MHGNRWKISWILKISRKKRRQKKSRLLRGIYILFNSKFPTTNYKIHPHINDTGYHMDCLDVKYNFDFIYEGEKILNPTGGNFNFKLRAEFAKTQEDLEQKIGIKISNRQLDKTKYLVNQKIKSNGNSVDVSCRLKKIPNEESEINKLCDQLWSYVIRDVFTSIYGMD